MKKAFEATYPQGHKVGAFVLRGGAEKWGLRHIMQRHFVGYWDGTIGKTAGEITQTVWPVDTTVSKLIQYAEEAGKQVTSGGVGRVSSTVNLSDGITAKIVTENGSSVSFFPISGPGVIDWHQLINVVK